jgi:MoaA/NifB/PqqE/SkfB family radical SAM enzyme
MKKFLPRLIAWELTGKCNLKCVHCRASAVHERDPNELLTEEMKNTIDNIVSFSNPIIILTGGEPLVREDVFEIAKYGTEKGLRVVLGTNATLITPGVAQKLIRSGIKRISVSLDGSTPETHDDFRKLPGAFDAAMKGIEACKKMGLDFQINTTVTKRNINDLQNIFDLAIKLGAEAHHIFLLVPTGRGKAIEDEEIPPEEYERVLNWMYDMQRSGRMPMKATCAPHFFRVVDQRSKEEGLNITAGRTG